MKTCKTGCGKMKAGGSVKKVKKMATGGQALNKAKGFAPAQKGGSNVSKQIYGIPNAGTTGPNRTAGYDYKKGGSISKAKFGASVPVKSSCKKGMVRGADGNCVMERPKFQKGGSNDNIGGPSDLKTPGTMIMLADKNARSKYFTPDNIRKEGIKLSDKEIEKRIKIAKDSLYNKYMKDAKLTPEKKSTTKKPAAKKMAKGGSLKPVPADKVGLSKLPTAVRNKMGFQKKGGSVKK
jgi:hypothetical protein